MSRKLKTFFNLHNKVDTRRRLDKKLLIELNTNWFLCLVADVAISPNEGGGCFPGCLGRFNLISLESGAKEFDSKTFSACSQSVWFYYGTRCVRVNHFSGFLKILVIGASAEEMRSAVCKIVGIALGAAAVQICPGRRRPGRGVISANRNVGNATNCLRCAGFKIYNPTKPFRG